MSGAAIPVPWAEVGHGRLVVRMPNWLGDAMFALPVLRALRAVAPRARIELLARPAVAQVLAALDGLCDGVVEAGVASSAGVLFDARRLRGAAAVLLLPNSFGSALGAFVARVPIRVGAAKDGRALLLTHPLPPPRAVHQAATYLAVSGFAHWPAPTHERVSVKAEVLRRAREGSPSAAYAVLVPGAAFGPAKQWGEGRFVELGRNLRARGLELLVLGSAGESALAAAVASGSGGRSLAGETDGALFAGLLARAAVVVANDSGALHLAAALGTPAVGIYGATSPEATGPLSASAPVLHHPVACSPCLLRDCNQASHLCMEAVTPGEALAAAVSLLQAATVGAATGRAGGARA